MRQNRSDNMADEYQAQRGPNPWATPAASPPSRTESLMRWGLRPALIIAMGAALMFKD